MGILNMIHFNYTPLLKELASLIVLSEAQRKSLTGLRAKTDQRTPEQVGGKKRFICMSENEILIFSMEKFCEVLKYVSEAGGLETRALIGRPGLIVSFRQL